MFIVFEGVDNAGKTTQLRLVGALLRDRGLAVTSTREPGGSPTLGPVLRELLLHTGGALGARAEALLFAADRAEHVRTVIRPALDRGEIVLCDRFVDSTLCYQGAGRGLDTADLLALSAFATDHLLPDLVLVFDLDPALAAQRQVAPPDRMESAGFGDPVRSVLLQRAAQHPDTYVIIDAHGDVDTVTERVLRVLLERVAQFSATPVTQGSAAG